MKKPPPELIYQFIQVLSSPVFRKVDFWRVYPGNAGFRGFRYRGVFSEKLVELDPLVIFITTDRTEFFFGTFYCHNS